jgi:hypothetical protein
MTDELHTMRFLRILLAWLTATAVTAVTGSIIQTQYNLYAIAALGVPVPAALRVRTTLQDLVGFAPTLALITAAGFIVAFLVAAGLARSWPDRRRLWYTLAGAAALAVAILAMNALLPVTAIGATRWLSGTVALAAAGGLGGWLFGLLALRRERLAA